MCARYELRAPSENIIERFGLSLASTQMLTQFGATEIRPTDHALTIGQDNSPALLPWGLKVSWQAGPVINARAETAAHKPTFAPLLNQRVLVPASAYYEWQKTERSKIKTQIGLSEEPLFAMAGFYSGNRFVILTCAPDEAVAHVHNRMPVILSLEQEQDWINPDIDFRDLTELLRPFAGPFSIHQEQPKPAAQRSLFD